MSYDIAYDPTVFVRSSIKAVIETLLEAVALVVLVVVVFLQSWRASVVPLVAVPVAIIGTLAILLLLGFSINSLTLFGLVLATGIVVDDAIVVVENVERKMEDGLAPVAAAHAAMAEVTRPIISIMLVLCSVFVPVAFLSGVEGQFYRQFAITIAASTVISTLNSLTLSPALAALLLQPRHERSDFFQRGIDRVFGALLRRVQPGIRLLVGAIRRSSLRDHRADGARAGGVRRAAAAHVAAVPDRARRLHPGAGQAIPDRHRAAAGRRVARSHRSGRAHDVARSRCSTPGRASTRSAFRACRRTASSVSTTPR